jgi:3-oxoacyl-[acyl-carrier protein] reductase
VLVNNAAMPQTKRILEITEADWDREMAVNLKGYFNWSQAVAPQMLKQGGGRMINISSVSANHGPSPTGVSRFAYSAAKAGVLGLTRGLARELAPTILVNAICPGPIETERTRDTFAPNRERIVQSIPLGRIGTSEDIDVVAAFLATAEPLFMTGEVIDVDGGSNIN